KADASFTVASKRSGVALWRVPDLGKRHERKPVLVFGCGVDAGCEWPNRCSELDWSAVRAIGHLSSRKRQVVDVVLATGLHQGGIAVRCSADAARDRTVPV